MEQKNNSAKEEKIHWKVRWLVNERTNERTSEMSKNSNWNLEKTHGACVSVCVFVCVCLFVCLFSTLFEIRTALFRSSRIHFYPLSQASLFNSTLAEEINQRKKGTSQWVRQAREKKVRICIFISPFKYPIWYFAMFQGVAVSFPAKTSGTAS